MKKLVLIGMLFSMIGLSAQGTGEIKGVVMDKETGLTVIGANVWIEHAGNKIGAATDIDGRYTIKPIPSGTYNVYFTSLGKSKYTITDIVVKTDKVRFVDTAFMVDTFLKPIVVRPKDVLIDPEEPSKLEIDSKQISQIAGGRNQNDLATIVAGGAISKGTDGELYFRGSRSGTMITFLDGIKIRGDAPAVPQAALKSYRVYTGGVPAKYGDTMGGVIEIETKNFFDLYNQRVAEMGITYENE